MVVTHFKLGHLGQSTFRFNCLFSNTFKYLGEPSQYLTGCQVLGCIEKNKTLSTSRQVNVVEEKDRWTQSSKALHDTWANRDVNTTRGSEERSNNMSVCGEPARLQKSWAVKEETTGAKWGLKEEAQTTARAPARPGGGGRRHLLLELGEPLVWAKDRVWGTWNLEGVRGQVLKAAELLEGVGEPRDSF